MLGKTHAIAGALAAATLADCTNMPRELWIPALAAGAVAGLLPDLDMPGSSAARAIPGYSGLARGELPVLLGLVAVGLWAAAHYTRLPVPPTLWMLPAAAFGISALMAFALKEFITHRGPTHSVTALAVFTAVLHLLWPALPTPLVCAAAVGYASHILIDLWNPNGAAVLWPLTNRKWSVLDSPLLLPFRLLVVRTGGPGELYGWRPVLAVLLIVVVVYKFAGVNAPALLSKGGF